MDETSCSPYERTMQKFLALALVGAALTSCGVDDAQLAETDLFNQPARRVKECFGEPSQRQRVGVEQVWIYDIGRLRAQGWLAALGLDEHPPFTAPTPDCQMRFTVDSHGVRGIDYTDAAGHALPQAEVCQTTVRACLTGHAL